MPPFLSSSPPLPVHVCIGGGSNQHTTHTQGRHLEESSALSGGQLHSCCGGRERGWRLQNTQEGTQRQKKLSRWQEKSVSKFDLEIEACLFALPIIICVYTYNYSQGDANGSSKKPRTPRKGKTKKGAEEDEEEMDVVQEEEEEREQPAKKKESISKKAKAQSQEKAPKGASKEKSSSQQQEKDNKEAAAASKAKPEKAPAATITTKKPPAKKLKTAATTEGTIFSFLKTYFQRWDKSLSLLPGEAHCTVLLLLLLLLLFKLTCVRLLFCRSTSHDDTEESQGGLLWLRHPQESRGGHQDNDGPCHSLPLSLQEKRGTTTTREKEEDRLRILLLPHDVKTEMYTFSFSRSISLIRWIKGN